VVVGAKSNHPRKRVVLVALETGSLVLVLAKEQPATTLANERYALVFEGVSGKEVVVAKHLWVVKGKNIL
jgi:hypothetical protein